MTTNSAATAAAPASDEQVSPRTRTALIVDDSPMVRSYHGSILAQAGFTVTEAGNGYEGVELVLHQAFDLILADVNMPVMDGYAFVERVRQDAVLPEVPIIMISTEREGADQDAAFQAGANFYVVKPAEPQQLTLIADLLTAVPADLEAERS